VTCRATSHRATSFSTYLLRNSPSCSSPSNLPRALSLGGSTLGETFPASCRATSSLSDLLAAQLSYQSLAQRLARAWFLGGSTKGATPPATEKQGRERLSCFFLLCSRACPCFYEVLLVVLSLLLVSSPPRKVSISISCISLSMDTQTLSLFLVPEYLSLSLLFLPPGSKDTLALCLSLLCSLRRAIEAIKISLSLSL
jgi:hypothetical protein